MHQACRLADADQLNLEPKVTYNVNGASSLKDLHSALKETKANIKKTRGRAILLHYWVGARILQIQADVESEGMHRDWKSCQTEVGARFRAAVGGERGYLEYMRRCRIIHLAFRSLQSHVIQGIQLTLTCLYGLNQKDAEQIHETLCQNMTK